jgi:pantothenate kinase type III
MTRDVKIEKRKKRKYGKSCYIAASRKTALGITAKNRRREGRGIDRWTFRDERIALDE